MFPMRQVAAVALALLLALFLLPLLLVPQGEGALPVESGSLPIDRTVVTPEPALDSAQQVKVKLADGTVETMALDDYLWGVVAAEMPAAFESEALQAQAVAARTYTYSKMERDTAGHPEADLCTDVNCCQAYRTREEAASSWGTNAQMYTDKIAAAVADTDGVAVLYGGKPIQAVFFSSADGRTVDAVEVWGNSVPYLTGVDSPEGEEVPNYHSNVTLTAEEFKTKLLAKYSGADLSGDPSGWFSHTVSNSAGGVSSVDVGGITVSGQELRTLFSLRSTSFTVSAGAEGVTFSVTGYGHGVGMSQYGANALAQEGKSYEEILKWYYTGVEVEQYTPGQP